MEWREEEEAARKLGVRGQRRLFAQKLGQNGKRKWPFVAREGEGVEAEGESAVTIASECGIAGDKMGYLISGNFGHFSTT